jgi:hypothetical protein
MMALAWKKQQPWCLKLSVSTLLQNFQKMMMPLMMGAKWKIMANFHTLLHDPQLAPSPHLS